MNLRRLERLERLERLMAVVDWASALPEGVTAAAAERAMQTWARMTVAFFDTHFDTHTGVSIEEAAHIVLGTVRALGEDDDDDDDWAKLENR